MLRLRVPRGTVALLIRVPAGPGTGPTVVARARLRVPAA